MTDQADQPAEDAEAEDAEVVASAEAAAFNPTVVTEDNTEDED